MTTIIAKQIPSVGDEFTIQANGAREGTAAGVFVNGKRVALARGIEDHAKNPIYNVFIHGHGQSVPKGMIKFRVETVYE
jgi:hypothetical protein